MTCLKWRAGYQLWPHSNQDTNSCEFFLWCCIEHVIHKGQIHINILCLQICIYYNYTNVKSFIQTFKRVSFCVQLWNLYQTERSGKPLDIPFIFNSFILFLPLECRLRIKIRAETIEWFILILNSVIEKFGLFDSTEHPDNHVFLMQVKFLFQSVFTWFQILFMIIFSFHSVLEI